jgi:hypothetical protein
MDQVGDMRILIQPRNVGGTVDDAVQQACEILHEAGILSARDGGMINDRPIVLVAPKEIPEALTVLGKAGIRAAVE